MWRCSVLVSVMFTMQCGYGQIYDCFPFFNELEILDIRLHELYDHVDKFVLVESVETHSGKPKPLYYEQNQERYKKFSDKIIHVVLEDRIDTSDPWVRENFQRNQIVRGLKGCLPDDIIMISDVDEIIRGSVIQEVVKALYREKKTAIRCEQTMYRYYLNAQDFSVPWMGTCATTFCYLSQVCPEEIRVSGKCKWLYPLISNAGWHFTCMGGLEAFSKKIEAYAHQEHNFSEYKTIQAMHRFMEAFCSIVPLDDTFPAYVVENQEYFLENGYLYEEALVHKKPLRRNVYKSKRSAITLFR